MLTVLDDKDDFKGDKKNLKTSSMQQCVGRPNVGETAYI